MSSEEYNLSKNDIHEIELSISFGQRFVQYEQEIIKMKLNRWDNNEKYDQHLIKDKAVITDIISKLERGDDIGNASIYKKMMTVPGREFFKREFKSLTDLNKSETF